MQENGSSGSPTKAERTRARILDIAQREASLIGIDSLTLGGLAQSCGLSKSGLNAHFGSKEALQIAVIDAVAGRFRSEVAEPALAYQAGKKRLEAIMACWIAWSQHADRPGGCQLIAATFDFDGLDGRVRDRLEHWMTIWRGVIIRTVEEANTAQALGHDPENTASLAFGLYMAQHMERQLLGDDTAGDRALGQWRERIAGQPQK